MTEQHNDHAQAAAARAQHYALTDPPVNRVTGVDEKRSAVGDFAYQVGVNLAAGAGVAGLVAGAKVVADKVTGSGDPGKDEEDHEGD